MNLLKIDKNIVCTLFAILLVSLVSCDDDSDDTNSGDDFDHEAQIAIDQNLLDTYFQEHYIHSVDGELIALGDDELPDGETLLSEDPKLLSIEGIEANETVTNYTMYYYITEQGVDESAFGTPSPVDSVFVKYTGLLLDGTQFDSKTDYPIWFQLAGVIPGWSHGFQKFKRGTFASLPDDDFEFFNQGKGYLFIPSGLGYRNFAQGNIPANSPLAFQVELNDVNLIDTDLDDVPTKFELTIDDAGNYEFYDTDGDGFDDYNDKDDDNDGILTKEEVAAEYKEEGCSEDSDDENYCYDERGNIKFDYDPTGKTIVAKGTTDGIPNYKNKDK